MTSLRLRSQYQTDPSGPRAMPQGAAPLSARVSARTPADVMRAASPALVSVNQKFPSGPCVIASGRVSEAGAKSSVTTPDVVTRPIAVVVASVNQRLPSAPAVMSPGSLLAVGIGNSVIAPAGVIRPTL